MSSLIDLLSPVKTRRMNATSKRKDSPSSKVNSNNKQNIMPTGSQKVLDLSQEEESDSRQGKRMRAAPSKSPPRTRGRKPLGEVLATALNQQKKNGAANTNSSPVVVVAKKKGTAVEEIDLVVRSAKKDTKSKCRQTITPEQSKIRPLAVDDRIRVFFDRGDDVFGKDREGAQGYWHGTVLTIPEDAKGKSNLTFTVLFDNGETEVLPYCAEDETVERVIEKDGGQYFGEVSRALAGEENPAKVDIGDLVLVNYCNQEQRFRGRVACVGSNGKFCEIAYDDGDYEHGVPIGEGKIFLLEDGSVHQQWMEGLELKIAGGRSNRKTNHTIKVIPDNETMVELKHVATGSISRQSYQQVAQEIFAEVKQTAKKARNGFHAWPSHMVLEPTRTTRKQTAAQEPETAETKSVPKRSTRKRAPKKQVVATSDTEPSTSRGPALPLSPNDFFLDPWLSDEEDDGNEDEDEAEALVQCRDMSNSIRYSFWRALNSSEASFGSELLFKMTNFHNKIPNDDMCRDMVDLLSKGPLFKKTRFPDCVRLEMLNRHLELLLKTKHQQMGPRLAKVLDAAFTHEVLEQIENPAVIYCVEGDESRVTSAALLRVGPTLSVKTSSASLLCHLLEHQLQGYRRFGPTANSADEKTLRADMQRFKEELLEKDLTRDILKSGGAQVLKLAVRAAFSVLIYYGHYLSSDLAFPSAPAVDSSSLDRIPPHARSNDQTFVATETGRLVKCMGRLCSYMAWIYCIDLGVSLYEARFVIRDTVEGLLSSAKFDPLVFLKDSKGGKDDAKRLRRHWNDMKLKFALSLDKRISGRLGEHTSKLFECGGKAGCAKYF
ncbi:expressed unknown protein [Seminavis robusta]|uniref:Uncharacterized protein n=1 Tax=Seminavis robusta TaxID=568900 RepID=A0A9N8HP07_9STRA|nr:expressed unknown protein [Seminavis robusta]|eukprot:Sro865_g212810.1 n/a (830) ;mRNA; r:14550-17039